MYPKMIYYLIISQTLDSSHLINYIFVYLLFIEKYNLFYLKMKKIKTKLT